MASVWVLAWVLLPLSLYMPGNFDIHIKDNISFCADMVFARPVDMVALTFITVSNPTAFVRSCIEFAGVFIEDVDPGSPFQSAFKTW